MQLETGGSDVSREVPGVTRSIWSPSEDRTSSAVPLDFYLTDPDGYFGALKQWQRRARSRRPRPEPEPTDELRSHPGRSHSGVRVRGRRTSLAQIDFWAWAAPGAFERRHENPSPPTAHRRAFRSAQRPRSSSTSQLSPANTAVALVQQRRQARVRTRRTRRTQHRCPTRSGIFAVRPGSRRSKTATSSVRIFFLSGQLHPCRFRLLGRLDRRLRSGRVRSSQWAPTVFNTAAAMR